MLKKIDNIKNFYRYYTRDVSYKDVEKLFKQDAPEVLEFYRKRMKHPAFENSLKGRMLFIRNLFIEFLMQMPPARRLFYTIAFFLFILGAFYGNWQWAFFSFILLNLLIAFELADKVIAKDELGVAREIQASLMPKEAPVNKHFDICGYSESAREVGGDYFDFITDENDPASMFLVIGDISGKGMGAAIHMVQVRTIIHNLAITFQTPKEILSALNKSLSRVLQKGSFFTVSIAALNGTSSFTLSRAGHLPLIHYSASEGVCTNITPSGMGLGLGNNFLFDKNLEEISVKPSPGDVFVFYTDGITEAMNYYLQEFGEKRLMAVIKANAGKSSEYIRDAILDALAVHTQSAPKHDDITLVIMKAINPLPQQ